MTISKRNRKTKKSLPSDAGLLQKQALAHLPVELIGEIMKVLQERDRCRLRPLCHKFNQAYKNLPRLSAQHIFESLLMGVFPPHLFSSSSDCPQVIGSICFALRSSHYSHWCSFVDENEPELGSIDYAFLLAIAYELSYKSDWYVLTESLREQLMDETSHLSVAQLSDLLSEAKIWDVPDLKMLTYVPAPLLRFLFLDGRSEDLLGCALKCLNIAAARFYFDEIAMAGCSETIGAAGMRLCRHKAALPHCLVHDNSAILTKILDRCDNFNHFDVIGKAILSGEINLKDPINQLICWWIVGLDQNDAAADYLLRSEHVDLLHYDHVSLQICDAVGFMYGARHMLRDPRVRLQSLGSRVFEYVGKYGSALDLEFLINRNVHFFEGTRFSSILKYATHHDNVDILRHLLIERKSLRSDHFHMCLEMAASDTSLKVLDLLFSNPVPDLDFSDVGYTLLMICVQNHNLTSLEWLLSQSFVNPAMHDNQVIITAAKETCFYIVDALLKDGRVDPSARDNEAFKSVFRQIYDIEYEDPQYRSQYYKTREFLDNASSSLYLPFDEIPSAVIVGKLLLQDSRVTKKLRQLCPKRKNLGLSGSLFYSTHEVFDLW